MGVLLVTEKGERRRKTKRFLIIGIISENTTVSLYRSLIEVQWKQEFYKNSKNTSTCRRFRINNGRVLKYCNDSRDSRREW